LGIPTTIQGSVKVIAEGAPDRVDLGEANGRCFVNLATVGLTTLIAENLDERVKRRFGRVAYLIALFKALPRARRFDARIAMPGHSTLEFRPIQIVLANGRYHGGPFPVTPDADIHSGTLAGYSVNTSRKGVLVRYALRLWFGRHVEMDEVEPFSAAEIEVWTDPTRRITVDGETRLRTPGSFRSLPDAIRVMVKPSPPDSRHSVPTA
jgi:diacylglycerol kinase family enzyme